MQKHTKIYLKAFGYDLDDHTQFIPSHISGLKSVDLHHIISRGKCGEDRIENLMALTREEHIKYGDKKKYVWFLLIKQMKFLSKNGIQYDNDWFIENLNKYEVFSRD